MQMRVRRWDLVRGVSHCILCVPCLCAHAFVCFVCLPCRRRRCLIIGFIYSVRVACTILCVRLPQHADADAMESAKHNSAVHVAREYVGAHSRRRRRSRSSNSSSSMMCQMQMQWSVSVNAASAMDCTQFSHASKSARSQQRAETAER